MTAVRRVAYVAIAMAYVQVVFGAIVRITGSGMGCGDHWPRCHGRWLPDLGSAQTAIELTHRVWGALLGVVIVTLYFLALRLKRSGDERGAGVFRSAQLSVLLVAAVGLLGREAVRLGLHPYVVVVHLTGAMAVLGALVVTAIRAGGFGSAGSLAGTSSKTFRGAGIAVILVFLTLIMGALTANIAGASYACRGFPWCRSGMSAGGPLHLQITHRVLAFLVLFHMMGLVMGVMKRGEPPVVTRWAWIAFGSIILQVVIAAALVETGLPPAFKSLHQAIGTLVWIAVFTFAMLARKGARSTG